MSTRMEIRRLTYYVGEVPEPLVVEVNSSLGADVDLTAATVELDYRLNGGSVVNRTGAVVDGPTGLVGYAWTAADFTTAGTIKGTLWYTIGGLRRVACPLIVTVLPPLEA